MRHGAGCVTARQSTRQARAGIAGFTPVGHCRAWIAGAAWLVLAAAVSGCAAEPPPLRVGANVWPGYEPLFLARDLGLLDASAVRLVEYSSASEVIRAFRNRAVEAATLTLDETLLLAESGQAPRIVLVMDFSAGGDAIVARPDIRKLTALRGRRVGVENSAVGAYMLARARAAAGLGVGDFRSVPLEVHEHERAYRERRVDAVVTFEPVRTRLIAAGAHVVFDSRALPGEIVDVLVVHADVLEPQAPRLRSLLSAWFAALAHLDRFPDDAARRIAPRMRLEPREVLPLYGGLQLVSRADNLRLLSGSEPALASSARGLVGTLRETGLLRTEVDIRALLAPAVLEGARP